MVLSREIVFSELIDLLSSADDAEYFGEPVTQLEHALQAAKLAEDARAGDEAVIAALLHDVGHLAAEADAPRMGSVGVLAHESIGARYLAARGFSKLVVELVQNHVEAKRYLARTNARYLSQLSAASLETLSHQGGPMSAEEAARFAADPLFAAHLRQRSWDEQAKVSGLIVPGLDRYLPLLERHLERP
jgi:putative nucleotidyltransferase with HDIG domain